MNCPYPLRIHWALLSHLSKHLWLHELRVRSFVFFFLTVFLPEKWRGKEKKCPIVYLWNIIYMPVSVLLFSLFVCLCVAMLVIFINARLHIFLCFHKEYGQLVVAVVVAPWFFCLFLILIFLCIEINLEMKPINFLLHFFLFSTFFFSLSLDCFMRLRDNFIWQCHLFSLRGWFLRHTRKYRT